MSDVKGSVAEFRAGVSAFMGQVHDSDQGAGPTGAAGGQLSGTYPNPDLANATLTSTQTRVGVSGTTVADSVAFGHTARAQQSETTAIGGLANANDVGATVVGYNSIIASGGLNSTSVGRRTYIDADYCVAVGQIAACNAPGTGSTCVGRQAVSSGAYSTCLGFGATSTHADSICIGKNATSVAGSSLSIVSGNAPVVAAAGASDVYLLVAINGVQYKLLLHT